MNNKAQLERLEMLVEDARKAGGRIVAGGERLVLEGNEGGYFYEPTIVADLKDDDRLVKEEQFGLALPILKYEEVDDGAAVMLRPRVALGRV